MDIVSIADAVIRVSNHVGSVAYEETSNQYYFLLIDPANQTFLSVFAFFVFRFVTDILDRL